MIETFRPLIDAARGIDLSPNAEGTPQALSQELARRFDPEGDEARALNAHLVALLEEGRIAERGEAPLRFGRAAKASNETDGFSIDVVHMSGPGPRHRHPRGEIDYCIALEGEPTFDGHGPGWVVYAADSTHVPTVAGGTMLIVYLLPGGEIEFQS